MADIDRVRELIRKAQGLNDEADAALGDAIDALGVEPPHPPPPSTAQRVHYWNGTHSPSTFGHVEGVPMSRHGTGNIRTYYEAEQGLWMPGTGKYSADGARAKAAGCEMWVWDIEVGALFGLTHGQAADAIAEVRQHIPVGLAPKIGFGHFHGWRGQRTWGMDPDQALQWAMDAGVTGLFDWHYSATGQQFVDLFLGRTTQGFRGIQCAIMEPRRTWDGNRPATAQDVRLVHAAGYSVGWFCPPTWRGQPLDYSGSVGMAEARRLYG